MSLIKGENVMLYGFDTFWKPMVCGLSCSITTNAGTIGTSVSGAGAWATNEYAALSWEAAFDGLVYLQKVNSLALPDLRAMQFARQKLLVRFTRIDGNGVDGVDNSYETEGIGIITSISDAGSNDAMATFNLTIVGTGPLTELFVPTIVNPSGKVKRLEYTGIAGEVFFTSALLNLKDVLSVSVDGVERSKKIIAGTPLNQEFKYTSSGGLGRIEVPQPLDTDVEVVVLYQDL